MRCARTTLGRNGRGQRASGWRPRVPALSTASRRTVRCAASSTASRSRTGWTGVPTARRSTTSTRFREESTRSTSTSRAARSANRSSHRRARVPARDRLRRRDVRRHGRRALGSGVGHRRGASIQPGGRVGRDHPSSRDATNQLCLRGRVARRARDHDRTPRLAARGARAANPRWERVLLPHGIDGPADESVSLHQARPVRLRPPPLTTFSSTTALMPPRM